MKNKETFRQEILEKIGAVDFPEAVIEQTFVTLMQGDTAHLPLRFKDDIKHLHNPQWLETARNEKRLPICYLSRQLLDYYALEAVPCAVLNRFFYILRCEMEVNLSWYLEKPGQVFTVNPTQEMKAAENLLWDFLEKEPIKPEYKLHYRHLLNALFLFPDYLSRPDDAFAFLNKLDIELKFH